ncbi:MAG: hypothetical protein JW384_00372 [Nitrosomonadaceae bacterium]|nr:hypothetical protein [Nitrosomonadaceae bacterium]
MGDAGIPARVKTVISICGKARRIESASITGRPISAATAIGISVFMPPTSIGMMATGFLPKNAASEVTQPTNSGPAGTFSEITVGAPMTAVVSTNPSGSNSSGEAIMTEPKSSMAWRTIKRAIYGSPPPPAPSKVAPSTMSSRSSRVNSRIYPSFDAVDFDLGEHPAGAPEFDGRALRERCQWAPRPPFWTAEDIWHRESRSWRPSALELGDRHVGHVIAEGSGADQFEHPWLMPLGGTG